MVTFEIEAESLRRGRVYLERIDRTEIPAALAQIVLRASSRLIGLLTRPTLAWSSSPAFDRKLTTSARWAEARVTTDDRRYNWTNFGTRPHIIRPRGPGYPLRFMSGYSPSTRPGSLQSSAASTSGSTVYRYEVHHPGTLARRFDVPATSAVAAQMPGIAQTVVGQVLRDR